MKVYKETLRIKSYHVDSTGNLSAVQVFNFLQEAAYRHSVLDGFGQPDLDKQGLVWMLSRVKVQYCKAIPLGETISLTSWVRTVKGALSERDFTIFCEGQECIKATSLWVCLSKEKIAPVALPNEIAANMQVVLNTKDELRTSKIRALTHKDSCAQYIVKPSDIDMVQHTNHVAYVRMLLDEVERGKLEEISVNYLQQTFEGDALEICTQMVTGKIALHQIEQAKGMPICRLQTIWR